MSGPHNIQLARGFYACHARIKAHPPSRLFLDRLWSWLRSHYAGLPERPVDGHSSLDLSSTCIRVAIDRAGDFVALECLDMARCDQWDAFLLRTDGCLHTGWRRRCSSAGDPPAAWLAAVEHFMLDHEAVPKSEPDFNSLSLALAGASAARFSYQDIHAREALTADVAHWKGIATSQAASMRSLRLSLASRSEAAVDSPPAMLTLQDLPHWAEENVDRILVLPRALAECKKALYQNHRLVFDALEILADVYPRVKASTLDRMELKRRCDELGLEIGGSVEPSNADDRYYVSYGGRRRLLDQHLAAGTSRDARFCLRIYWFWDEDDRRVVVGWLPTHLSNSMT